MPRDPITPAAGLSLSPHPARRRMEALRAHIRHAETPYDSLLAAGHDREDARFRVQGLIEKTLAAWES